MHKVDLKEPGYTLETPKPISEVVEEVKRKQFKEQKQEKPLPWYELTERLNPYKDLVALLGFGCVLWGVGKLNFVAMLILGGLSLIYLVYLMGKCS